MTAQHQDLRPPPTPGFRPLSDEENRRAVDRIEQAERSTPYCLCGAMTGAVAHGDAIWLECSSLGTPRQGVSGLLARLANGFGHTRHVIVELPTGQA